jgi:DNA-binding GntR family transcriptional regulator
MPAEIKKISIKNQVYELVKARILTRAYKLNSRVNINALSEELNISNTPIREALSMLENDGLVTLSPGAGYQVFALTDKLVLELRETMSVFMIGGYFLCRFQDKAKTLADGLRRRLATQERMVGTSGASLELARTAIAFDRAFFSAADNSMLEKYSRTMIDKIVLVTYYDYRTDESEIERTFKEHAEMLKAVEDDDPERVETLIAKHFNRPIMIE